MKTILKYVAYDGREFIDQTACQEYEDNCRAADLAVSRLPPRPKGDGCAFENGHGYIQHDRETFLKVRRLLLEQAKKESPHAWIDQAIADETVHPSWAHRWISECCCGQLGKAWYRILCTDSQFREWGQPFYAANPDKGEQVCLNPLAR
jgi:hypothetical protein